MVQITFGQIVAEIDDSLEWSVTTVEGYEPPHRLGGRIVQTVKDMLDDTTALILQTADYMSWPAFQIAEQITREIGGEILEAKDERSQPEGVVF